jgi:thymidylate kinase
MPCTHRVYAGPKLYTSVDGIVGSGKSTVINEVYKILSRNKKHSLNVVIIPEPLNLFSVYHSLFNKTHNPLQCAYENPQQNAAIAQLHFLRSSVEYYGAKLKYLDRNDIAISERSMESSPVFIKNYFKVGIFSSMVKDYMLDEVTRSNAASNCEDLLFPHIIFRLKTTPQIALDRIVARGRAEEKGMSLEYLEMLDTTYTEHFATSRFDGRLIVEIDSNSSDPKKAAHMIADIIDSRVWWANQI